MEDYSFLEFLKLPVYAAVNQSEEEFAFSFTNKNEIEASRDELLISKVKIPMIQRDYAQGREDQGELRKIFVNDLFEALEDDNKVLNLDFIYGTISSEKEKVFLPLDGQQRLTTLFLMHWLIIKLEKKDDEELLELLNKFSYETRDSARKFYEKLIKFEFEGNPVEQIKNSHWFKDSYRLDPTISASLKMIESLYKRYMDSRDKGELFNQLNRLRFFVLPMNNFNLTDDLYIKLNARGKVLSPFENFKADLLGWMQKSNDFKGLLDPEDLKSLTKIESIASKFDNNWASLFWNGVNDFEKSGKEAVPIDDSFYRVIHRLIINDFIVNYSGSELLKDRVYVELLKRESNPYFANLDYYTSNGLIDESFINKLEILLDNYCKDSLNDRIEELARPIWDQSSYWSLFDNSMPMNNRLLFDGINQYLLNLNGEEFDESNFENWIKIVWNLIIDPDNRSIGANKRIFETIRKLATYSLNISQSLIDGSMNELIESLNNVEKLQLREEVLKARKIHEDPLWEQVIIDASAHPLFAGNIGFIINSAESPSEAQLRLSIANQLFKDNGPIRLYDDQHHMLMRFVLSEFIDWDQLAAFNFTDSELNWRTYLRRNSHVISSLQNLLVCENIEQTKEKITDSVNRSSIMHTDEEIKKIAHFNLYNNNDYQIWMQSDGVNKVRWLGHHFFAVRPNAWYSKVMIDCVRNEVITALISQLNIDQLNGHKCGDSNYYMMEQIELNKQINNLKFSFHFDNNRTLRVGLKSEINSQLENPNESYWIEVEQFDYVNMDGAENVSGFIDIIKQRLLQTKYMSQL